MTSVPVYAVCKEVEQPDSDELGIADRDGSVAFHEVLEAVGQHLSGHVDLPAGTEMERNLSKMYAAVFKDTGLHKREVSAYSAAHIWAICRMQNQLRRRIAEKKSGKKTPAHSAGSVMARFKAAGETPNSAPKRPTSKPPPNAGRGTTPKRR